MFSRKVNLQRCLVAATVGDVEQCLFSEHHEPLPALESHPSLLAIAARVAPYALLRHLLEQALPPGFDKTRIDRIPILADLLSSASASSDSPLLTTVDVLLRLVCRDKSASACLAAAELFVCETIGAEPREHVSLPPHVISTIHGYFTARNLLPPSLRNLTCLTEFLKYIGCPFSQNGLRSLLRRLNLWQRLTIDLFLIQLDEWLSDEVLRFAQAVQKCVDEGRPFDSVAGCGLDAGPLDAKRLRIDLDSLAQLDTVSIVLTISMFRRALPRHPARPPATPNTYDDVKVLYRLPPAGSAPSCAVRPASAKAESGPLLSRQATKISNYLHTTGCSPRAVSTTTATSTLEDVILRRARLLDESASSAVGENVVVTPSIQSLPMSARSVADLRPTTGSQQSLLVRSILQEQEDLNHRDHMRAIRMEQRQRRGRRSPPRLTVKLPSSDTKTMKFEFTGASAFSYAPGDATMSAANGRSKQREEESTQLDLPSAVEAIAPFQPPHLRRWRCTLD